ncbi:MAG TPA: phosphoribosylglycinamide formyltransferase [Acidimicrobiales bacterium]|nr:phosphoribosylglycinamide formyltransferase [Acidimicrobiales bacterium]
MAPAEGKGGGNGGTPGNCRRRLAVLASGTGTILEALIAAELPIVVVGVDRSCRAARIAEGAGIPVEFVERRDFSASFDREAYTEALVAALARHRVGTVAMAGFATVLGPTFFPAFEGRVLNTHPALLPAYKGWHAVRDVLAAGETTTGSTVHVATCEVDAGPILAQEKVPIRPDDTEETLHERIKQVERRLYPATILSFLDSAEPVTDEVAARSGVAK